MVTTHALYTPNRACTACSIRQECEYGAVPGVGPYDAEIMFVGEGPGRREDRDGLPFVGPAGKFLDDLLRGLNLHRSQVYITNVVKCRPTSNRTPNEEEAAFCGDRWLQQEINMVKPKLIVALGLPALKYLTGYEGKMADVHGQILPHKWVGGGHGTPVYACYHPASGLHSADQIPLILADFQGLRDLLKNGKLTIVEDEYPEPVYQIAQDVAAIRSIVRDSRLVALDTETVGGELWSVQISINPGQALFIPAAAWEEAFPNGTPPTTQVAVHNWLYDSQFIDIPNYIDTMVMAYNLGLPQGLKALAKTLCGMDMKSYTEMVRPYSLDTIREWLTEVAAVEWPDCEPLPDEKWDLSKGTLATKLRKPKNIGKKAAGILKKIYNLEAFDNDYDPYEKWNKIDPREREMVEEMLGPPPLAELDAVPFDDALYYAARDPDATLRVLFKLQGLISDRNLHHTLHMDAETLPVAAKMMESGMRLNSASLQDLSRGLGVSLRSQNRAINRLVGREINPNSNPQVAEVLFDSPLQDGLGLLSLKSTKAGESSTKTILKRLRLEQAPGHPQSKRVTLLLDHFIRYKTERKVKEFADKLPKHVSEDGRIHFTIKPTRTSTGRWAVADPNTQQIPTRTELGRRVRGAFIAEEGWTLLAADYSQIEMRVKAHLSQCQRMMQLFHQDRDVHSETSALLNGLPLEQASESRYRSPVKNLGFGVIYLISEQGLYDGMVKEDIVGVEDWDVDRCREFIREYFRLYPEIEEHTKATIAHAAQNGWVQDIFGRRRYIPQFSVPVKWVREEGAREAANMPVQSSAQGIIKLAMGKIHREVTADLEWWRWLLQMHDELIWELRRRIISGHELETWHLAQTFKKIMESTVSLSVPVKVNVKEGTSWGQMREITDAL